MSADTVLVTELTTTYSKGGMRYGPFKATAEKPYLEVPASIALASGAPVYDGEPIAAEQAELTDSVQLDDLLKANHDLKDSLDTLTAERDTLQARVAELEAGNGQLLPAKDEAITRISSVKRVSDEMAAEIYTALTAPKSEAD